MLILRRGLLVLRGVLGRRVVATWVLWHPSLVLLTPCLLLLLLLLLMSVGRWSSAVRGSP